VRRHLSWIFAGTLLLGGLAACSDDDSDDDGGTDSTEQDSGDSGDSGTDSDNEAVQEFCDNAQALADELGDVEEAADLSSIQDEATTFATESASLASANADDADAINECAAIVSDAFTEASTRLTN
jgi:outer membrane protein OmpA-like peptidoglycan-associated protein